MVDIDFFKSFNDRFGHAAGDACLRRVAEALQGAAVPGDVVARYGGEEFAVFFRACELRTAVARAERMRAAIGALAFSPGNGVPVPVTVSIGVAAVVAPAEHGALGVALEAADAALYAAKQYGRDRVVAADEVAERRKPATGVPQRTLPPLRTVLFGRAQLLDELTALIEIQPVLTLTGSGGSGKSTLALALAHAVAARFAHGVTVVELAPIVAAELVAMRVAEQFGIRARDDAAALAALGTFLRRQNMLLVFDGAEHVSGAVRAIADACAAAPRVRLLVTSRSALGTGVERIVLVPPLDERAALATFKARAPDAARAEIDAYPALAQAVCRHLDGLPLALELAAANLGAMTLAELHETVSASIAPRRDKAAREHAAHEDLLRKLYDVSYATLEEREQRVFRLLSVFAGGWTLAAAAGVAALEPDETTDVLATLVERSLVLRAHSREAGHRFALLDSAREYARIRASEAGETAALERAHGAYFASRAARAAQAYDATPTASWLPPLERELANFRAALARLSATDDAGDGARFRLSLLPLFSDLGLPHEGYALAQAVARSDAPDLARARASVWQAHFANVSWRHADALEAAGRARDLAQRGGEPRLIGGALAQSAAARIAMGDDFAGADRALREALLLHEAAGVKDGAAHVHVLLGVKDVIERGDAACALEHYHTALALYREIGRLDGIALALTNIALAYGMAGLTVRSISAGADAVAALERVRNTASLAVALNNLASFLAVARAYEASAAYALRALPLNLTVQNRLQAVRSISVIAEIAMCRKRHPRGAVRLYGFEEAEYARLRTPFQPHQARYRREMLALATEQIGEADVARQLTDGARLALDDAVALAYEIAG